MEQEDKKKVSAEQLATLYDLISAKITMTVTAKEFSTDLLRPLVLQVVDLVQSFSDGRKDHLTGPEKQRLALDLAVHVLQDLAQKGVLTQAQLEQGLIAIEFAGPALIDGAKALYKELMSTVGDIREHGCAGCCSRNC